jgi:hypothetical protein
LRKNKHVWSFKVGEATLNADDLEIAKMELSERHLSLSIVKGRQVIFEAKTHGVLGFMEAVEKFKDRLDGASVADRVVGKAIALLSVYVNVKAVYAMTISRAAKALLEGNAVHVRWDTLVENILDAGKSKTCPFEQLVERITDPADAYRKLKSACSSATHFMWRG